MTRAASVREQVLGFVERYPGAHAREIERQLGLSSRLASYHLGSLEADGKLARLDDAGYARYVERARARALTANERRFLFLARRAPALHIMLLLASEDELAQGDITRRVGLAKASVSYHLKALAAERIVVAREDGRHRLYALRDPAATRALLQEFQPLPGDLDGFGQMWADLFG